MINWYWLGSSRIKVTFSLRTPTENKDLQKYLKTFQSQKEKEEDIEVI